MHGMIFARVGCCPCSASVHGIQFLDSFILSLSSCSRTCNLCKGGVMIRLLGFWELEHSISFSCNVSCPRNYTIIVRFFLSLILYIATHYVVVENVFTDCDVIVIDSVWFKFVSVPTRSWARVPVDPATQNV